MRVCFVSGVSRRRFSMTGNRKVEKKKKEKKKKLNTKIPRLTSTVYTKEVSLWSVSLISDLRFQYYSALTQQED